MNKALNSEHTPHPLCKTLNDESYGPSGQVDYPELRLDRAREALRGLSALVSSDSAGDEALMGRRGDLASLIEIIREELEVGLTGKRLHL